MIFFPAPGENVASHATKSHSMQPPFISSNPFLLLAAFLHHLHRKSELLLVRQTREEKNLESVFTNGRQTKRKIQTSVERARLYSFHRLSSIGEYIFQVVFFTHHLQRHCIPVDVGFVTETRSENASRVLINRNQITKKTKKKTTKTPHSSFSVGLRPVSVKNQHLKVAKTQQSAPPFCV